MGDERAQGDEHERGDNAGGGDGSDRAWYIRLMSSLYIATFAVRVSFAIIFIAFPKYLVIEGYLSYALVLAVWPVMELSTVLVFGADMDRRGRRAALVYGATLAAVALFLFALSDHPVPVAIVNGLLGVAAAAILVSSLTLVADYAPPDRRGRVMGVFNFVQIFGWLFGFAVGGVLVEVFLDRLEVVFVIAGAMCAFGAAYAYRNVKEPRRHTYLADQLSWSHLVGVLRQRAVVLLVLPWFVIYILISTVFTFMFKASFEELGLSGYELTGLLLGGGALLLGTFVLFGRLSDSRGRMPIIAVGTAGMAGLMVTIGVMFLTWPGGDLTVAAGGHVTRFLVPVGVFAFMAGAFAPSAMAALVDNTEARKKGMTMGVYSFVISVAMAAGPVASGAIIDRWGGSGILAFLLACMAVMVVLVAMRWWDVRREGGGDGPPPAE